MSQLNAEGEALGSLPKGWVWTRLRDIAALKGGLTKGQKRKPGERVRPVPYLRVANVQRGYLDLGEMKEIEATEEEIAELRLRKGDLLFNEGGDRDKLGRGWVWQNELPECIHQNHVFRGRLLLPELQPKFVSWYSNSFGQRYFLEQGKQTTNLASINLTKLGALPVPIPPADEQRRIVAEIEKQLSDLDAGVAALKRVQANLKRYRASVLKAACEGRLVPTEAELARAEGRDYEPADKLLERILQERRARWEADQLAKMKAAGKTPKDDSWKARYPAPTSKVRPIAPLPEGWTWAFWDETGFSQNGRPFPSSDYQSAGVRLLRPGNLHVSGKVTWTAENTRCLPEKYSEDFPDFVVGPGELVMNLTAQSLKDEFLGRVCMTVSALPCMLNQRIARLTPVGVDVRFVFWMFKSPVFRSFVDGLNTGSLIQHMFTSQLVDFAFPLPPKAEQMRIVTEIERQLSLVEQIEIQLNVNETRGAKLRKSILKRAFEGKLVTQDPNDEPASVLLDRIRQERASPTGKPTPGQMSLDLEKPKKPRTPRRRPASA